MVTSRVMCFTLLPAVITIARIVQLVLLEKNMHYQLVITRVGHVSRNSKQLSQRAMNGAQSKPPNESYVQVDSPSFSV